VLRGAVALKPFPASSSLAESRPIWSWVDERCERAEEYHAKSDTFPRGYLDLTPFVDITTGGRVSPGFRPFRALNFS